MTQAVATLAIQPTRLDSAQRTPSCRTCVEAGFPPGLAELGKLQLPNVRTRHRAALRHLARAFAIALLGVLSAPATADDSGRLRLVQVLEDGKDGVEGLYGPALSALSPDGANVYVANFLGDSVVVFARDAPSGRLSFLEAQRNGVNGVDGLGNAIAVVVSPDGRHVYVASQVGSAIAVFTRDPAGRLTFVQAQRDGLPAPDARLRGLAISPDGAHVYACGFGEDDDVGVLARDASSGRLTPVEVVSTGLPPTYGLAVSPDGAQVYAAGVTANAITAFQRDPTTGRLTRLAAWRDGVDGVQGLAGALSVVLSADGASVYVAGFNGHAVAVFARDKGSGLLSFIQAFQSGVDGVQGLKGPSGTVVGPDGAHLWASAWADKAIGLFSRDSNTGRLGFVEARRDVVSEWIGMGQVNPPVPSPDGKYLYAASYSYNAMLVFSTDAGGMAPIVRCVGDCDWSSQVTVDELVRGVNIARGTTPLSACEMFDDDGAGTVTVDKLVHGVNNALHGCVEPLTPGDHRRTLELGGYSRIYDVHIPPGYDGSTPVPLVLDFHGFTNSPTEQAGLSGWRSLADSEDFIVAYPLGLFGRPEAPEMGTDYGPSFNGGPLCCGFAALRHIDDVGFARAIVQAVVAEANIDRTRVYATGLSGGGYMSSRLGCEAADLFAGVAPLAGFIGLYPMSQCQPSRPIPVIEFAGLHDPGNPYPGLSTDSFAYWRDVDGCGSGPPDERVDFGTSYCETYRSCGAGVQAELCSIEASQVSYGGGHVLYLNPDLDLTRTAWEFLSQFRLPAQ
jgi:poly(3-hydroxybutyrate) depolymerase/6-phosphogluconolactonase (cycloisomerase 2 family)